MNTKRVVCCNCMDGRTQLPVIEWIKGNSGADHVDMITEAGMDGFLQNQENIIDSVTDKIKISIEKNGASIIFVVGHHDCKGNPVDDGLHKEHTLVSVSRIKKEFDGIEVKGLWVNDNWEVEELR